MLTPWRRCLYKKIAGLSLEGRVLDLGGSRKSGYHELISGSHEIVVVNLDAVCGSDESFDLEKPFPIGVGSYDAVLAMNVLEHIFDHRLFLAEAFRVLKSGGKAVIGVPFFMNVHPSPHDYWRYTEEALSELLKDAGFKDVKIEPVGSGPFTASAQLLSIALPVAPVRVVMELAARMLDAVLGLFVGKQVLQKRYPLGYYVQATK